MSRNRTALRTQKRKAIRLDLPAAQQYLEQRVYVQIADLILNILRNVALLRDFQNLQAQPCDNGLRRSVFKHLFDFEWHDSLLPISCGATNDFALRTELRSNDSALNLAWHMGVILAQSGSWTHMSLTGHGEKNSRRAYVFRTAPIAAGTEPCQHLRSAPEAVTGGTLRVLCSMSILQRIPVDD
jgi:hypothetical protein